MTNEVVVVGVGMMTAVGLTAPETAASVRAATMRFSQSAIHDRRFAPLTLAEVPDDGMPALAEEIDRLADLTARERRMLRLGTMPLLETVTVLPPNERPPGLALALPEMQPGRRIDGEKFLRLFAHQATMKFDPSRSAAVDEGRAGALMAISRAAQMVRTGQAAFALAGAIDSYRDLYVLGTLDAEERVKSGVHLDGFIPGEGASFLLLTAARTADASGLRPLASLTRLAVGEEPGHLYSAETYRGDGLAGTFAQLFASGEVAAPVAEVYSSMNGESHWAKEWGVGFVRNKKAFLDDHGMHHPADCFGDTGAASGPLLVGLAAMGMRDAYRGSPALVYCSSDHGARAALAVGRWVDRRPVER